MRSLIWQRISSARKRLSFEPAKARGRSFLGRAAVRQSGEHLLHRITAEVKYRDSFKFTPFVTPLFPANKPLPSCDSSEASTVG
jgi:hypothetical protein